VIKKLEIKPPMVRYKSIEDRTSLATTIGFSFVDVGDVMKFC
jgi:hypothetical protein